MSLLLALVLFADISPPRFELDGNLLKLPGPIVFQTGSDKLKPESDPVLAHVKAYLEHRSDVTLLRVEVHSDAQGSSVFNQTLSEKRALAVARALVARGVDCKRLIAVGFGESKPLAPNTTAEGRAQNRRISFVNAALRGRPIGGQPVDGGGKVAGDSCAP
jgi:OOP family OmpA-OmpF porin